LKIKVDGLAKIWNHGITCHCIIGHPQHNAKKIETWNKTGGHVEYTCSSDKFRLAECAVNCYTQWISGLSCPQYNISTELQYEVANARLRRYNFIIILEKLKDKNYARAIEKFFGVDGVTKKRSAFCERASHRANLLHPANITKETRQELANLNELDLDLRLYNNLSDCENEYNFGHVQFSARVKGG
jgi:hypothetical protein